MTPLPTTARAMALGDARRAESDKRHRRWARTRALRAEIATLAPLFGRRSAP